MKYHANKIANWNEGCGIGPDSIHTHLLKECSIELSVPPILLYKKSISIVTVSETCKISYVLSTFKKGCKSDLLNYHLISLTSVACKTMEHIITKSL